MGTVFSQSKWEIQFNNFIHTNIYLLKVNKRNTRASCEISSKLTINISERRQRRSDVVLKKKQKANGLKVSAVIPLFFRIERSFHEGGPLTEKVL